MHQVNSIYFDPDNYESEYLMWDDITEMMRILCKNDHIIVVRQDEFGQVFLDFETANRELGAPFPFWLSPEEEESVVWDDAEDEEDCLQ